MLRKQYTSQTRAKVSEPHVKLIFHRSSDFGGSKNIQPIVDDYGAYGKSVCVELPAGEVDKAEFRRILAQVPASQMEMNEVKFA